MIVHYIALACVVTKDVIFYSSLWKANQTPKRKGEGMFYWNPKNHLKIWNKRGIFFAMKTLIFFQFSQTNWPPNAQALDNAIHWINHCSADMYQESRMHYSLDGDLSSGWCHLPLNNWDQKCCVQCDKVKSEFKLLNL